VKYMLKTATRFFLPDKAFIWLHYLQRTGKILNFSNPQTFNEKIQWLKLNWRNELATQCCDKYEVRKFVESRVGPGVLNELYGVYNCVEEIDIEKLPDSFVLKVNHGSGQQILCKNKNSMDWDSAFKLLASWLKKNHYYHAREWGYKNVVPKIICEKYLEHNGEPLIDYKFFCFDGVPRFVEVHKDRCRGRKKNTYDMAWKLMDFKKGASSPIKEKVNQPPHFAQMAQYAAALSKGFPFVRVDLYDIESGIIFGEMTLYPGNGHSRFDPDTYDALFGSYLKLPAEKK
jgi:hypothetical protein